MAKEIILDVKNLKVSFDTYAGEVQAVRGVSFHVEKGEVIAIVGESGCGKSVTAQAIMKLIPMPPGRIKDGKVIFNNEDITNYSDKQMQKIRGAEIAMIFQDPMTSLNPTMTLGNQISEGLRIHQEYSKKDAKVKAIEMLKLVEIPQPELRVDQYPHEFSGGMRQRAMIAIALACNPKLLIADEPTTALDVTIQAQILDLMKSLQDKLNTSIILITHDLGVVSHTVQKVIVMYAGIVVEKGTLNEIFYNSKHPYTWGLLNSIPRLDLKNKETLEPIEGSPPDLLAPPKGCPFAIRCEFAMKVCYEKQPEIENISATQQVSCWLSYSEVEEKFDWKNKTFKDTINA